MTDGTEKTKISRLPKRGSYDTEVIHNILDEGLFCTISYCIDNQPFVIPNGHCRIGSNLYIHGFVGSHFLRGIVSGIPVVINVTLLDGFVLARSAFHHSMNYRSVVIFSNATVVEEEKEKEEVLKVFTDRLVPGRWNDVRQPTAKELAKTMVLKFPIKEASAKIRTGGVNDDQEDLDFPVWAGVVPLKTSAMPPIPDPNLKKNLTFNYPLK